jgi:hypothetical protein
MSSLRANNFRLRTHQSVAYTATAGTIANAFGVGTWAARVVVTSAAFVRIGSSPTATTSDVYLPADRPEVFVVNPGEKVSAVQVTAGGTLHVTELA